eukprot:jgi/Mesen1/5652/ME000286S04864
MERITEELYGHFTSYKESSSVCPTPLDPPWPSINSALPQTLLATMDAYKPYGATSDKPVGTVADDTTILQSTLTQETRSSGCAPVPQYKSTNWGLHEAGFLTRDSINDCGDSVEGPSGVQGVHKAGRIDCLDSNWTDSDHQSYLSCIEASFVEKMYQKQFCEIDLCGMQNQRRASGELSWLQGDAAAAAAACGLMPSPDENPAKQLEVTPVVKMEQEPFAALPLSSDSVERNVRAVAEVPCRLGMESDCRPLSSSATVAHAHWPADAHLRGARADQRTLAPGALGASEKEKLETQTSPLRARPESHSGGGGRALARSPSPAVRERAVAQASASADVHMATGQMPEVVADSGRRGGEMQAGGLADAPSESAAGVEDSATCADSARSSMEAELPSWHRQPTAETRDVMLATWRMRNLYRKHEASSPVLGHAKRQKRTQRDLMEAAAELDSSVRQAAVSSSPAASSPSLADVAPHRQQDMAAPGTSGAARSQQGQSEKEAEKLVRNSDGTHGRLGGMLGASRQARSETAGSSHSGGRGRHHHYYHHYHHHHFYGTAGEPISSGIGSRPAGALGSASVRSVDQIVPSMPAISSASARYTYPAAAGRWRRFVALSAAGPSLLLLPRPTQGDHVVCSPAIPAMEAESAPYALEGRAADDTGAAPVDLHVASASGGASGAPRLQRQAQRDFGRQLLGRDPAGARQALSESPSPMSGLDSPPSCSPCVEATSGVAVVTEGNSRPQMWKETPGCSGDIQDSTKSEKTKGSKTWTWGLSGLRKRIGEPK